MNSCSLYSCNISSAGHVETVAADGGPFFNLTREETFYSFG